MRRTELGTEIDISSRQPENADLPNSRTALPFESHSREIRTEPIIIMTCWQKASARPRKISETFRGTTQKSTQMIFPTPNSHP
jgi:hypothetical protein